MSQNDVEELLNTGITDEDDLRYAEFTDLPGGIPVIKRRKLDMIGKFLAKGRTLSATIMVVEIQQSLNVPVRIATPILSRIPDPYHRAPKVHTGMLSDFLVRQ